jgi:hypothetical protein
VRRGGVGEKERTVVLIAEIVQEMQILIIESRPICTIELVVVIND